jgi:V8-like Glu-specific endopeptidase
MDGKPEFLDADRPRLVNGTGWFIAPGLVITNHHVINARRKDVQPEPDATESDFQLQAEHTTLQFDYVKASPDSSGVEVGAGALQYSNAALDFALLRIPDGAAGRPPLRLRKNAIKKNLEQALGMGVNLLQHPNGEPMRLGFRNNYVIFGSEDSLSYLTDTAVGSSGSPVCDDAWTVAALHSGSRRISDVQINILGHQFTRENFGIPITAVLAHLAEHAPALHEEISQGQVNSLPSGT